MNNEEGKKPDVLQTVNGNVMKFPYYPHLETAPGVHIGLNSFYMEMRQAVHNLHNLHLRSRREKMRELFIQDFLRENEELGEVNFGYMNTQP